MKVHWKLDIVIFSWMNDQKEKRSNETIHIFPSLFTVWYIRGIFNTHYTHSWIHLNEFEVHKIEIRENICVILIVPTSFRWMCWLLTSCKFMRNTDNNFKHSHLKIVHALYFLLALLLMLVSVCALSNGFYSLYIY